MRSLPKFGTVWFLIGCKTRKRSLPWIRKQIIQLREENDRCTWTQTNSLANKIYCGRRTIAVPGLDLIQSRVLFIAGVERSVYRDSVTVARNPERSVHRDTAPTLTYLGFIHSIRVRWRLRKIIMTLKFISGGKIFFLLREKNDRCTGTRVDCVTIFLFRG